MEVRLNLEKHCIKTEIKKVYEKNLSLCLKGKGFKETEELVENLKSVMENNNLVALRGIYKELLGKNNDKIVLVLEDNSRCILINDNIRVDLN